MEIGATEKGFAANVALRRDQKGKSSAWAVLKVEELVGLVVPQPNQQGQVGRIERRDVRDG